jgi:hypothetical protein
MYAVRLRAVEFTQNIFSKKNYSRFRLSLLILIIDNAVIALVIGGLVAVHSMSTEECYYAMTVQSHFRRCLRG